MKKGQGEEKERGNAIFVTALLISLILFAIFVFTGFIRIGFESPPPSDEDWWVILHSDGKRLEEINCKKTEILGYTFFCEIKNKPPASDEVEDCIWNCMQSNYTLYVKESGCKKCCEIGNTCIDQLYKLCINKYDQPPAEEETEEGKKFCEQFDMQLVCYDDKEGRETCICVPKQNATPEEAK